MLPIKIIIPGKYWDSQIHSERLYLFDLSGEILTLDWSQLLEELKIENYLYLVFQVAFQKNDLFYSPEFSRKFQDSKERKSILDKFSRLSRLDLLISKKQSDSLIIKKQKNPFPFPHTDSLFYRGYLYVSSLSGVYRGTCQKTNKNPVSSRPARKSGNPVFAMSASRGKLALAAGSDGLFLMDLKPDWPVKILQRQTQRISQDNCIDCHWTFDNIFCSSHILSGYLVDYTKYMAQKTLGKSGHSIRANSIFQGHGYSWGGQDKLCQARDRAIHVVRYNPKKGSKEKFEALGTLKPAAWEGEVVSAKIAYWGVIVEFDDNIVVFPSEGEPIIFQGEPVSWRIFPQSKQYANQMHIIYEDRIEIISFNHDYFVDQKKKIAGIEYI